VALILYFGFFKVARKSKKQIAEVDDALMEAAKEGDLQTCQELVEEENAFLPSGPEYINKLGKKNALHQAAQYGHREVADWLVLEKLVPVDTADYSLMRPLHYAAMKGKTSMCKRLLHMKADPTVQDTAGYTCMHFAASGGYEETAAQLKEGGAGVNARDKGGHTPLMLAAVKNKAAVMQWLLDNDADKYAFNSQEATALDMALRRKHKAATELLEGKPTPVVPQAKRSEAEEILKKHSKAADSGVAVAEGDLGCRQRPPSVKNTSRLQEAAKSLAESQDPANLAKKKSKKLASNLSKAGIGSFSGDFNAKMIKEKYPDAWERAKEEIRNLHGGEDALESLLDTVE